MRRAATRSGVPSRWPSQVAGAGERSAVSQWQAVPDSVPASERMSALCIRAADGAGKERLRNRLVGLQSSHSNELECPHLESMVGGERGTCKGVGPLPL